MTPESARQRWCPFARSAVPTINQSAKIIGEVTINRTTDGSNAPAPDTLCIAGQCMAWRWKDMSNDDGYCGLVPHLPSVEKAP